MKDIIVDRDEAIAQIRAASGLRECADAIISALQPSVLLLRERIGEDDAPIGASRFGGAPDLPAGFEWPSWEIVKKKGILRRKLVRRPGGLDFLAQLNLAEVPAEATPDGFPSTGLLYVFYDTEEQPWDLEPNDQAGARICFVEDLTNLQRTPAPASRANAFKPCRITPAATWSLPEEEVPLPPGIDEADLDEPLEEYQEEVCPKVNGDPGSVLHRMFGFGQWIQNDATHGREERLFLQIDSDDGLETGPGWMWGDAGRIYFILADQQIVARAFGQARMTVQCY